MKYLTNPYGMRIYANPLVPRTPVLQLSQDFKYCSDEFRNQMNAWLLETFGDTPSIIFCGNALYVSPETYLVFKDRFGMPETNYGS